MSNLVTPQQVWDAWSAHLIPYFQKCEKTLTDRVIQDIVVKYASDRSISFQKQLTEYMRSQVGPIVYNPEPIDTLTFNCQDINNGTTEIVDNCQNIDTISANGKTPIYLEYTENSNYLIYSDGSVYSKYSKRFLSSSVSSGYYTVSLQVGSKKRKQRIHRLVALHFVNNLDASKCTTVNHKDGNKFNNNYLNLEWVTPQDNSNHAVSTESYRPSHTSSVHQIGTTGNIVNTFDSIVEAAKHTGISKSMISHCCGGRAVKSTDSKGIVYRWQFVEDTQIDDVPINAKSVSGFENYTVTTDGQVYSLRKKGYLIQRVTEDGYMSVCLKTPTRKENFVVHRLVADIYLPKDSDRPIVNHKDSNRRNNHVSNLEYVTLRENSIHSSKTGNNAKLKKPVKMIDPVKKIIIATFASVAEASITTKINVMSISCCCNKKYRLAGGYLWQFEDEVGIREIAPKITAACAIEQLDIATGEIIASFASMTQAAQTINGDVRRISDVCSGKLSEYKGWAWRKITVLAQGT